MKINDRRFKVEDENPIEAMPVCGLFPLPSGLEVRITPRQSRFVLEVFKSNTYLGEYERATDSTLLRKLGEIEDFAATLESMSKQHGDFTVRWSSSSRRKEVKDSAGQLVGVLDLR